MRLFPIFHLLLCLLLYFTSCISQRDPPDEDYSNLGWFYISDNDYANTSLPIEHPVNVNACIHREEMDDLGKDHGGNVKKSEGIFFNIAANEKFDREKYSPTYWMEAKENGFPIMDALPLEGSSYCLSGKHYRHSKELYGDPNFRNMTPIADVHFDVGTHVFPKDMSKMNIFLPNDTNAEGVTEPTYLGSEIPNNFYDPRDVGLTNPLGFAPSRRGTRVGSTTSFYDFTAALQFFIQWTRATDTFFHTQRTRLRYKEDPGPRVRKLEDYPGSTVQRGDTVPSFRYRPAIPEKQPNPRCKNPYFIEVTEIEVNDVKLRNWLHITLYVRLENVIKTAERCATGKMKWIMLEVRDNMGLPIGDFDTDLPCEVASCKCKSAQCRLVHGHKHNAMPCMFTPNRALTHPGMFMYGIDNSLDDDQWFNEVHATWHFAQHSSYFATELHFSATIVESNLTMKYYNGRQTIYRNPRRCSLAANISAYISASLHFCTGGIRYTDFYQWQWNDTHRIEQKTGRYATYQAYCPLVAAAAQPIDLPFFDMSHHSRMWESPKRLPGFYASTLQHVSEKERVYGWNAQYTMLRPTLETLGGWDFYQHSKLVDPALHLNCHKGINEAFYDYKSGKEAKGVIPVRRNFYTFRRAYELTDIGLSGNSITSVMVSKYADPAAADRAASNDTSDFETVYMRVPLTINVTNPLKKIEGTFEYKHPFRSIFELSRVYFGTLGTKLAYEDQLGSVNPLTNQKGYDQEFQESDIGIYFSKQPTMQELAIEERCSCPALGPTLDPETGTRELTELQGRNAHAVQMLLAWIVLIPIGLFVSRYFKETYSRVYILEEYWWYTAHVMCMGTAFILMLGGIYSIEVKDIIRREVYDNWSEETKAHVIMGAITIFLFGLQLCLAPFRMWIVPRRIVHIIFHFVIGVMNYVMGAIAVLISVAIPQSRMSCSAFYVYVAFLIAQALLYVFMEFHMRYVDRLLLLYPPRSYLPPPIVRVFHTNAPLSQLRLYILIGYVCVCWSMFFIIRYGAIEFKVASCFRNLGNDYEEDA